MASPRRKGPRRKSSSPLPWIGKHNPYGVPGFLGYKIVSGDTTSPGNLTNSVRVTTQSWYDARGRQIKTRNANGLFNKQSYDTAGRLTAAYVCYDDDEPASASTTLAEAANVSGDIVIEQTKQTYDAKGNVWLSEHFRRY